MTWWKENQDGIMNAAKMAWDIISQVIIATMTVIQAIMSVVWPIIKSLIVDTWNAIKNVIQGAINVILGIIKVFASLFTGDWKGLWEGIKQLASGALELLWGILQLGFLGKIFKVIKMFGTKAINVILDMVSGMKGKFDDLVGAATTKFNGVKDAIINPIITAKNKVEEVVGKIKEFFTNLKLKIPKIQMPKLPKFTMSGSFNFNPPSVPKIGVDWYANGGLMLNPTVFGTNGNNLMVGGEAGAEAILPLNDKVLGKIGAMIAKTMQFTAPAVYVNNSLSNAQKEPAIIKLQLGRNEFETFVEDINQVNNWKQLRVSMFDGKG